MKRAFLFEILAVTWSQKSYICCFLGASCLRDVYLSNWVTASRTPWIISVVKTKSRSIVKIICTTNQIYGFIFSCSLLHSYLIVARENSFTSYIWAPIIRFEFAFVCLLWKISNSLSLQMLLESRRYSHVLYILLKKWKDT